MSELSLEPWFGLTKEDAARVVTEICAHGADFGELFFEDAVSSSIILEDGVVRNVSWTEDAGAGLRAVKGDTQAYGFAQQFDLKLLVDVGNRVGKVAGDARKSVNLGALHSVPVRSGLYSGKDASVRAPAAGKLEILKRADAAARAFSPAVKRVDITLTEESRILGLLNSDGGLFVDSQPMLSVRVSVVAEKDGKKQQSMVGGGGRLGLEYFTDVDPESLGKEAARMAVEMLDADPAPAGQQTVVLAPGDSGVLLHEAVGHGLEGDFNRKGTSRYSGKVGEKVASELCTVVDDGTYARGRGAIHVDDEGNASGSNVLIEKGILKGYMHDRLSAAHFKVKPTGNGRRQSYRHPPLPRMTTTYMNAGAHTPEEIIASVKNGIYCRTFSGGQVNISNGDFVFQATESFQIEDGKLTRPLKDVVIIGNGPDALSKVSMVGNDLAFSDGRWTCGKGGQMVPVGVGIPTVRIDGITVGGTK